MDDIEQFKQYTATVKLRRGDDWSVRPEAEQIDGKVLRLEALWQIDGGDRKQYAGEWAMAPPHKNHPSDFQTGWIASGDLTNIKLIE